MTMTATQALISYGALGITTAYFMAKDWFKSKETDKVMEELRDAIKQNTAASLMCNRNASVK